ncbi:MAG: response regulator transcription factor [Myxococcales bacterium]|nr:response regulator transcription factor [Myxococcota bacterium]MDW8282739.1 response regulator transcription factor [Myxococcales bacterium]
MPRVLIVEDERAIAESLEFALRRDGFEVAFAPTLRAAEAQLDSADLIVLDLMLPDGSGFDLLSRLRGSERRVPVIILTSRDEEADRVAGLEGGADDYVIKPFSPREVVARIRAVLRRAQPPRRLPASAAGRLSIDAGTRRCTYDGTPLDLTRTEFDLLHALASAPDRVFTRQQLIERIFGEGYAVTDRTIDAHIKALRRKLSAAGGDPELIETERGVGYRLRA